ncbi:hypothetical protein DAPPUDRAFT_234300 [Daphnia pulex]|uniref:Homeobox domain-containing protein n=1 Tax=Daphnia pulex TaxID=6669 RepID=E9FY29_DAPPU|nr:hypothetical protein DAPPUDRAFT_234300 [Daphnia pulex]|eukprot:EFX87855.1 hypothetical protein DAPPUDRAFT_234300 [Daphnia pulex]
MSRNTLISNPFSRDQRTSFWMRVNAALEIYFRKENVPTDWEIDFLAESLQLDRKVVHLWFSNRRQKEKRKIWSGVGGIRFAEMLVTQSKKKAGCSQNGMDLFSFPLHFTGHASHFKRFCFGKPNPEMLTRTVIFMATENGLVHQKFINQIINFIVDVQEKDKFRFQLVDEDGNGHSNCISVYDIHHADGFRIPFSLTIVVTPYSGDSEDSDQLFRDRKVAEMFREFIEGKDGIQELDMICNVTVETGEIKQPFLSIFGKDVEKNINNWKLSVDFLSDKGPWQAVVHHFFTVLATMQPKSVLFTKLVLDERKKMAARLNGLESLLTNASIKMEEINKMKEIIKCSQTQIEHEMEYEINQINYSYLLPNLSATSTITRFSTIPQENYVGINSRQLYDNEIYKIYFKAEKKLKDINSKGQYSVRKLQNELFLNGTAVLEHYQLTWRCMQQLNIMALHGNSFLTQKVFDLLFDAEQHLKELGFNEQLANLKKTKN